MCTHIAFLNIVLYTYLFLNIMTLPLAFLWHLVWYQQINKSQKGHMAVNIHFSPRHNDQKKLPQLNIRHTGGSKTEQSDESIRVSKLICLSRFQYRYPTQILHLLSICRCTVNLTEPVTAKAYVVRVQYAGQHQF